MYQLVRDQVGGADGELGDHRELAAELREDLHEYGDDEGDQADSTARANDRTTTGYTIAPLTWRRSWSSFSSWSEIRSSDCLEHAAGFAGAHHGHIERCEDLRVLGQRVGECEAGLDVLADDADGLGELLVLDLVLEHVERAQQRHARADHRRQLAGHDRQLVRP